jgi:hypothetical protein
MNTEDFEKRIQRQPLRQIPGEWRQEILQATTDAQQTAVKSQREPVASASLLSTLNSQLSTLLWPCPQAWAALAATWLVILGLHLASGDNTPQRLVRQKPSPSSELFLAVQEQKRLLTQLIQAQEPRDADRPKTGKPQPRSDCRHETGLA